MNEAVQLKALEAALAEVPDESDRNSESTVIDRDDVHNGMWLAGAMGQTARELEELIARMAGEIQQATEERDSYRRGLEVSEQANAVLRRDLAAETERADHNQRRFNETRAALEQIERYVEGALYGVRHGGAKRPQAEPASPPDDGAPAPAFLMGGPARSNVQAIPRRRDSAFARGGITAMSVNDRPLRN